MLTCKKMVRMVQSEVYKGTLAAVITQPVDLHSLFEWKEKKNSSTGEVRNRGREKQLGI